MWLNAVGIRYFTILRLLQLHNSMICKENSIYVHHRFVFQSVAFTIYKVILTVLLCLRVAMRDARFWPLKSNSQRMLFITQSNLHSSIHLLYNRLSSLKGLCNQIGLKDSILYIFVFRKHISLILCIIKTHKVLQNRFPNISMKFLRIIIYTTYHLEMHDKCIGIEIVF